MCRQGVDQGVQQAVAGTEVACGGPGALTWDEFEGGARGGQAVYFQPHEQRLARRPAGQVDTDPACAGVVIALDRPAQEGVAEVQFAVLSGALPGFKSGQAVIERDVNDPPENLAPRSVDVEFSSHAWPFR